jgi:hypothetical protein
VTPAREKSDTISPFEAREKYSSTLILAYFRRNLYFIGRKRHRTDEKHEGKIAKGG